MSDLSPARPFVLSESDLKAVRETPYDVAILPWGATEAHNFHLPYGTDVYESSAVAKRSAEIAWKAGAKIIVLPPVPFGVNTGQLDIPLTINMNPSTQLLVLSDIASSLAAQGIHKLVIINGHGGNDFRQMIRELQPKIDVFISTINWWSCVDAKPFFDEPGDHAGELETSVMMAIAPVECGRYPKRARGKSGSSGSRGFARDGRGRHESGRRSRTIPGSGIRPEPRGKKGSGFSRQLLSGSAGISLSWRRRIETSSTNRLL